MIIPCVFSLSGCFFSKLVNNSQEIVVDLPTIKVVSSLRINLRGSTQKTLYPSLSNNSVKNPEFTYVSSNNDVATVSEDGVVKALKVGESIITITLKANTKVKTTVKVSVVDKEIDHYDYTIMLYMCGSDLEYDAEAKPEEQYPFFTEDIKEILSVPNIPDTVKIIIETGGTTKWSMPITYLEGATKISSTNLQRWEVNNETNKLKLIETLPTNYMADENSFSEFLSWGLDDYEAEQMGVIMSGHGGGIAGCVYDDNYRVKVGNSYWQHTLRTFEVANAAKKALANSPKEKFTWIGYDCCVMASADIATVNSDYFEYMVASQENEEAIGWNHDIYLKKLYDDPKMSAETFLPEICKAFMMDKHRDDEPANETCFQTLSVLKLSYAQDLVDKFNLFSKGLGTNIASYKIAEAAFQRSFNNFGDSIYGLCDFNDFIDQFEGFTNVREDVIKAVNALVIANEYCDRYKTAYSEFTPCGVNAFFPKSLDDKYILQVGKEDYSNSLSTKFNYWQNMCVTYGKFGWDSI